MCDGISRDLRDTKILINENLAETSTAVLSDENSLTTFSSLSDVEIQYRIFDIVMCELESKIGP